MDVEGVVLVECEPTRPLARRDVLHPGGREGGREGRREEWKKGGRERQVEEGREEGREEGEEGGVEEDSTPFAYQLSLT